MNKIIIKFSILFVVTVLIQVLFLNNVQFFNYASPYFYLLFILLLPTNTPRYLLLLLGFVDGAVIDVFSNTPGLHSAATVFVSFIRPFVVNASNSEDSNTFFIPSLYNTSVLLFLKYAAIIVVAHHLFLFYFEAFTFVDGINTLLRSLSSSIFTLFLIVSSQFFMFRK